MWRCSVEKYCAYLVEVFCGEILCLPCGGVLWRNTVLTMWRYSMQKYCICHIKIKLKLPVERSVEKNCAYHVEKKRNFLWRDLWRNTVLTMWSKNRLCCKEIFGEILCLPCRGVLWRDTLLTMWRRSVEKYVEGIKSFWVRLYVNSLTSCVRNWKVLVLCKILNVWLSVTSSWVRFCERYSLLEWDSM